MNVKSVCGKNVCVHNSTFFSNQKHNDFKLELRQRISVCFRKFSPESLQVKVMFVTV